MIFLKKYCDILKVTYTTFLLICFLGLKVRTCETFFLWDQAFEFYILKFHDVINNLSIKQETHFAE